MRRWSDRTCRTAQWVGPRPHEAPWGGALKIRRAATLVALSLMISGLSALPTATADPGVRPELTKPSAVKLAGRKVTKGHVTRLLDPADASLGRIRIGYEVHRATGTSVGAILAIEGGPGYPSTGSRDYYLGLFRPFLRDHDLLLIDARGTGTSGAINCRRLQSYRGSYAMAARKCGKQLGATSDVYGSAFAADDFVAVLDKLGYDQVDVYGDSYGTFLGQTFAIRHPDRVRSLTLDAAYPVVDQNPWYPDLNRAMRKAFRLVCQRDEECQGNPLRRLRKVADRLDKRPLTGHAYDADGNRRAVRLDVGFLAFIMGVATYGTTVYEELDTAGKAWLRRKDPKPLLRIAAEQNYYGDAGPPKEYSEGQYLAVICNDYPQLWDEQASILTRRTQFDQAVRKLRRTQPDTFGPFTVNEWLSSPWAEFDSCITWRKPSALVPPVPEPTDYPDVPTLVLVGDLDSITSAEGSRLVADAFPAATYVEVANVGHVTALADHSRCASDVVRRFVRTLDPGDTSCAQTAYPAVRTTDAFPRRLAGIRGTGDSGSVRQRRVVTAVSQTVGDVLPRWWANYSGAGRGLRGGTFAYSGSTHVKFRMRGLRFVSDLPVTGRMHWDRKTGKVVVRVHFSGAASGHLRLRWNEFDADAQAIARGRVGGAPIRLTLPAP